MGIRVYSLRDGDESKVVYPLGFGDEDGDKFLL